MVIFCNYSENMKIKQGITQQYFVKFNAIVCVMGRVENVRVRKSPS